MKVEPETPDWINESRDVLMFRVYQWQKAVKVMRKQGLSIDEIHQILHTKDAVEGTGKDPP